MKYKKKLVLYFYPSGGDKQEVNFTGSVVEFFSKNESDFFIFYNQGSTGMISIYSESGNGISYTYPFSIAGKILSATQLNENIFMQIFYDKN